MKTLAVDQDVNNPTLIHLQGDSNEKKYFKRGDLIAKEQEEYMKKYRPNDNVVLTPSESTSKSDREYSNKNI